MAKMEYSREMNLNDWVHMFRDIYFPTQNYGRSKYELFAHFVRAWGHGSRYLFRNSNPSEARNYIAKIFAWYCALCQRLGVDLERVIWSKYPAVCTRCLASPCGCSAIPNEIDTEKLRGLTLSNAHKKPQSLREWQTMFASIYRGPLGVEKMSASRDTLAIAFTRFAEEIGEVAEGIDRDARVDSEYQLVIENEMADVFAWIMSIANLIHLVSASHQAVSIADVAWERYPGKCHHCKQRPCNCVRGEYKLELASRGAMSPSHWDPRTGLANAQGLERHLEMADYEYSTSSSGMKLWSMIFYDLDHFGQVNKNHGHEVGDQVLLSTAKAASRVVGKRGIVFRRGGEEFVVVLRGVDPTGSFDIADEIRQAIAEEEVSVNFRGETQSVRVTASFGVAICPSDGVPSKLEKAAEERAREAKSSGRDRVVGPRPTTQPRPRTPVS